MQVSVQMWTVILRGALTGATPVRSACTLTVNKAIAGLARDVMGRLGLLAHIRCTVDQIPRAIHVFDHARELRVVGGGDVTAAAVLEARAALECADRFTTFLSDETDRESNAAWLPRRAPSGPEYTFVCQCSENKWFGDVVDGLARVSGSMKELVIDYLGERDGLPNLSRITDGSLRVTIQQADFESDDGWGSFKSPAVRELVFTFCDLARLPPVAGFTNLVHLELHECMFSGEHEDALENLAILPVPPIHFLGLEGCEYVGDASLIAVLTALKTLVMHGCRPFPDFDVAAADVLKAKFLSGELNADGTGRMCKVIGRRLNIRKAEREAARLAQCDCCGPCDCGECSDCED